MPRKKEAGARNEKYGRQKLWTPDSKAKLGAHKYGNELLVWLIIKNRASKWHMGLMGGHGSRKFHK